MTDTKELRALLEAARLLPAKKIERHEDSGGYECWLVFPECDSSLLTDEACDALLALVEQTPALLDEIEQLREQVQSLTRERDEARKLIRDRGLAPKACPITGRPFFMTIDDVPTYGGPLDSFTIPERDEDGGLVVRHYDHDAGGWSEDEAYQVARLVSIEESDEAKALVAELVAVAKVAEALRQDIRGDVTDLYVALDALSDEARAKIKEAP